MQSNQMNQVLAAGVILYRSNNNNKSSDTNSREFLLLQKQNGNKWAPAKGRLEKDETDYDAAIRETQEETGLYINKDYDLIDSKYTIINSYKTSSNKNKRVVYWLAKVKDYNVAINLSNEHQSFKWMKINEIESLFNECDMTRACIEANDYLINLNK